MSTLELKELTLPIARYAAKHGLKSMQRWLPMGELRNAATPILVERGEISDILIIAFTGGLNWINFPLFEFFETTQTLRYSRILLKDKYRMFYHYGVDWRRRDWPKLLAYLTQQIDQLAPRRIFCIGSSSGGYAALVAGHYLKADYVHAFGPQTIIRIDPQGIREAMKTRHRRKLAKSKRTFREALDIVPLLRRSNGKTKFFVHFCAGHAQDRGFAERVAGLPRVTTFGYPGDKHGVATVLAKRGFLGTLLQHDNQGNLESLARAHFGSQVLIKKPSTVAAANLSRTHAPDVLQSNPPMR
jgi:hypothetical protein